MSKDLTFAEAQRHAYSTLSRPFSDKDGTVKNPFYTLPPQITEPAMLIQELPLVTSQKFNFLFAANTAPAATNALNNQNIGQNDVAVIFAIQLLIGYGATVNTRQYYSYGLTPDDNVIYNSVLQGTFETNQLMSSIDTNVFRQQNGTVQAQYDGCALINPLRIFTGKNSVVTFTINTPDISTLGFTANAYVSMRLWCCKGASSAYGDYGKPTM